MYVSGGHSFSLAILENSISYSRYYAGNSEITRLGEQRNKGILHVNLTSSKTRTPARTKVCYRTRLSSIRLQASKLIIRAVRFPVIGIAHWRRFESIVIPYVFWAAPTVAFHGPFDAILLEHSAKLPMLLAIRLGIACSHVSKLSLVDSNR